MPVEVGQIAPPFTLPSHRGEDVSLADFRGRSNVVIVFFPAAFSGVCTRQFTEIGAAEGRYAGEDAQVLGISVDNRESLRAWAEQLGLTDTLLLADFHPRAPWRGSTACSSRSQAATPAPASSSIARASCAMPISARTRARGSSRRRTSRKGCRPARSEPGSGGLSGGQLTARRGHVGTAGTSQ